MWNTKIENRNIKIVAKNISELLTQRAIAYWIMGDGTYNKKYIFISTESFTKIEVELLQKNIIR